jgi:hypothetical protein
MKLAVLSLAFVTMRLAAAAAPTSCADDVFFGVDRSKSISSRQLSEWRPMAQQFADALCPGAHLRVFKIDAFTLSNTPLFDEVLPQRPANATMDDLIRFRQRLAHFRTDLSVALDKAFSGINDATATDIFSLWDRVNAGEGRHTQFLIFSDALHCSRDLNLEKTRLSPNAFSSVIHNLAEYHRWSSTLSGVSVRFILPSSAINGPPPSVNDVRMLSDFYGALVRSLGGQLSPFDSYVH